MAMGIQLGQDPNTEETAKRLWDRIEQPTREVAGLSGEVAAGLALDAKTFKLLGLGPWGWAGYGAINFAGGASANIAAQKLRQEEDINWGEVVSSGLLGIIPGTSLRFGRKATKVLGGAGTYQRAATFGAAQGMTDQVVRQGINEGRLPTGGELATGAVTGGIAGPIFKKSFDEVSQILSKYQGKSSKEINKKLTLRERSSITKLQQDILKYKDDPKKSLEIIQAYREANFNFQKSQGHFEEFIDYEDYKRYNTQNAGDLQSKIDDPDFEIGFTKTDTLSDKQFKQYESFMEAYAYRQSQNELVRAKVEDLESRGMTVSSSDKRKIAGFISLNELEEIAKRNRRPRTDVWKYLTEQTRKEKELVDAIREINRIEGEANAVQIEQFIKNHESEITKKTLKYLRKLQKYAQYPYTRYWNKGHKRSLLELYLADITGGNVSSNMFIERQGNIDIQLPDGTTFLERGNLSTGADNPNLYTLVKLQNATWDLEDDFRKTIMPDLYPGEGINPEYEDIAQRLYRIHMNRAAESLGIKPEFRNLPPNKKELEKYSRSLTDALHIYFKQAETFGIPETEIQYREIFEIEDSPYEKQFQIMEDLFLRVLGRRQKIRHIGPFSTKTEDMKQPGRRKNQPKSG